MRKEDMVVIDTTLDNMHTLYQNKKYKSMIDTIINYYDEPYVLKKLQEKVKNTRKGTPNMENSTYMQALDKLELQQMIVDAFLNSRKMRKDKYQQLRLKRFLAGVMNLGNIKMIHYYFNHSLIPIQDKVKMNEVIPFQETQFIQNRALSEKGFTQFIRHLPTEAVLRMWKVYFQENMENLIDYKEHHPNMYLDEMLRENTMVDDYLDLVIHSKLKKKHRQTMDLQFNKYLLKRMELNQINQLTKVVNDEKIGFFLRDTMSSINYEPGMNTLTPKQLNELATRLTPYDVIHLWTESYEIRMNDAKSLVVLANKYKEEFQEEKMKQKKK